MKTVFVTDPLESVDASIATSVGLMHAAQDHGAEVWVTEPLVLEVVDGRARAQARRIRLAPTRPVGAHRWLVADPWYAVEETRAIWLDETAAVFMWAEPPLDATYLTATFVLDLVDPERTAVVNDPRGLRACSEHLFPLHFPDLAPPTLVTADRVAIRAFAGDHGTAVVKPVDGFSGHGVLRLDHDDPNLPSLLEISTAAGSRAVVVQPYLAQVADGNKRIFVSDGEPVGAVFRYPADGDFRIGEPSAEAPLTARDREICARLAPALRRYGVRVAGLDVIGPYLIEVNLTSPGAMRKADALLGWALCADVLDRVLTGTPALRRYA